MMTLKTDIPLYQTSLADLNRHFSRFNNAYEATYEWLTRTRPSYTQIDPAYMGFAEYVKRVNAIPAEAFIRPTEMQSLLGWGIRQSFGKDSGDYRKPSKVGQILHQWHHVLRQLGKEWGDHFITDDLPEEMKTYLEYVAKPGVRDNIALPEDRIEDEKKRGAAISNHLIDMFSKLQEFKVWNVDKSKILTVKNVPITVMRELEGDTPGKIPYNVPLAAIAWGIKHAGVAIKTRKENDPARFFLFEVIGLANEAGRKMEILAEAAPEAYDCGRRDLHMAIEAEKIWLKTVFAVDTIYDKPSKAFSDVLALIGENPRDLEFGSGTKLGMIMYALVERLSEVWHKADVKEENPILSKLSASAGSPMKFSQMATLIEELSLNFIEAGKKTERELEEAKEDLDFSSEKMAEYSSRKREIFAEQQSRIQTIFGTISHITAQAINAFSSYCEAADKAGLINEDFKMYWGLCHEFCARELQIIKKVDQHQRGRNL